MQTIWNKVGAFLMDSLETVVVSLSVWLVMYLFLMQPTQIKGSSMEPTFHNDQCVFTDKISYRLGQPQRGDVVSVHAPLAANCVVEGECTFFKRLIGLPGESVAVHDGAFYINNQRLVENYLPSSIKTETGPYLGNKTLTLGSDEYFVAGDNREHSADSRYFGPVTRQEIIGKAFWRYCPVGDIGPLQKVSY